MTGIQIASELLENPTLINEKKSLQNLYHILINTNLSIDDSWKDVCTMTKIHPQDKLSQTFQSAMENLEFTPIISLSKMNISILMNYDIDIICKFVHWIFLRQYKWIDRCDSDDGEEKEDIAEIVIDPTDEKDVKNTLENIVAWLENHDHLSYNLLQAYKYAIQKSSMSPMIRKNVILSFFHWMKNLSSKCVIVVWKCFLILKDIISLGITDVWSAIRKDTASRLSFVINILDERMLESLFLLFVKICQAEESLWQAVEGAARGIDKILGCCKLISNSSTCTDIESPSVGIKLGRIIFRTLPHFVKDELETVLFKLFAHPQLSIREIAGKAFSAFLYKSNFSYFMESFAKIMNCLSKDLYYEETSILKFMNAYEAEGFLNALLFLIKNTPLTHVMITWIDHWEVFSHYLIHPASTVRQTTSLLFKYILSKHQMSVCFLKLVLQNLASNWQLDFNDLTCPMSEEKRTNWKKRSSVGSRKKNNEISTTWEWREGRLLAYEVMMKYLQTNHNFFLLPNYSKQITIGRMKSTQLTNSINEGQMKGISLLRKQNSVNLQCEVSKKKLAKSLTLTQFQVPNPDGLVSNASLNKSLLQKARDETRFKDKETLITKVQPVNLRNIEALQSIREATNKKKNQDQCEKEINRWLTGQRISSFYTLIRQILLQTIESLEDQRWELRRMSQQLLPYVCDVIRCYDYTLLEKLYEEAFQSTDSVLYYGSCFCLQYSMKNYIKMKRLVSDGSPGKHCEGKKQQAETMVTDFEGNMNVHFGLIATNFKKCKRKEIKAISIQLLMLYHIHVKEQENVVNETIAAYFQSLYSSKDIIKDNLYVDEKARLKISQELLSEIQHVLQDYCESASTQYTIQFLPVILQAVQYTSSDPLDVHILLNCAEVILKRLKVSSWKEEIHSLLSNCLVELCNIFEKEDMDTHLLHVCNLVELLQEVCKQKFEYKQVECVIQNRIGNVEKKLSITSTDSQNQQNVRLTPNENRRPGSISDDHLSYSAASFESLRMADVDEESISSNSDEAVEDKSDEADELSSDWDFSSGDEADQDQSATINILSTLLETLKRNAALYVVKGN